MKFALALFCVVAAVQARSTSVQVVNSQRSEAALGENSWVVHIRKAVSTSGHLESCAGALIDPSWVLTSASCVDDSRFMWLRFGAVEVIRPEMVLESNAGYAHWAWDRDTGANNLAAISLNREVQLSANIAVVPLTTADSTFGSSATYCSFGETEDKTAGEWLNCWDVSLTAIEDNDAGVIAAAEGIPTTKFDFGAPLVSDGVLVGIHNRAKAEGVEAEFTLISAHIPWISGMTGIPFGRTAPASAPEDIAVNFVN